MASSTVFTRRARSMPFSFATMSSAVRRLPSLTGACCWVAIVFVFLFETGDACSVTTSLPLLLRPAGLRFAGRSAELEHEPGGLDVFEWNFVRASAVGEREDAF